tara:strand:+ start:147 stop:353 length:207 start_codon:yes stop_codon:yes gene_type:complete
MRFAAHIGIFVGVESTPKLVALDQGCSASTTRRSMVEAIMPNLPAFDLVVKEIAQQFAQHGNLHVPDH